MTETRDLSLFVRRDADGIAHMDLAVEGVGCAGCIRKIENGLKQLPGVVDARLNFTNRRLAVGWRDKALNASEVIDALARIGYRAHPFEAGPRRKRRGARGAPADAVPRGRGLRRHEHHAAVGVGVVRQPAT